MCSTTASFIPVTPKAFVDYATKQRYSGCAKYVFGLYICIIDDVFKMHANMCDMPPLQKCNLLLPFHLSHPPYLVPPPPSPIYLLCVWFFTYLVVSI